MEKINFDTDRASIIAKSSTLTPDEIQSVLTAIKAYGDSLPDSKLLKEKLKVKSDQLEELFTNPLNKTIKPLLEKIEKSKKLQLVGQEALAKIDTILINIKEKCTKSINYQNKK